MRKIDKIIIHCSDSDYKHHNDISVIKEWHLQRGFNDVGYHYFIKSDGEIQIGRKLNTPGAHCFGENAKSIGICLHGKRDFKEEQFLSLRNLIKIINGFLDEELQVYPHNFFNKNKTCPNFNVDEKIKRM